MKLKENGITMIALAVTIILLLILAGVTIGAISGKDGIIAKAKQAKDATEQARQQESNDIDQLYAELASYNGTTSTNGNTTDTTPDQNADLSNYYTKNETENLINTKIQQADNANNYYTKDVIEAKYIAYPDYTNYKNITGLSWTVEKDGFIQATYVYTQAASVINN